jgi:small subunit ribosomal protein S2
MAISSSAVAKKPQVKTTIPSLVELAEAGAHFGHHRSLTFPRSRNFVYTVKNSVAIINLEETQRSLSEAQKMFSQFREAGKPVLFVGTRRAVRGFTKEVAESVNCPFITERWFGGMLTNFSTMRDNIKRMNEEIEYLASDKSKRLSKKERLMHENKLERSRRFLGGVSTLTEMPALIVLASASEDKIAIEEANQVGIPVISITDTDMNPELITLPIPANDDSPRAVELILRTIVAEPSKLEPAKTVAKEVKSEKVAKKTTAKKTAAKKPTPKKTTKTKKEA